MGQIFINVNLFHALDKKLTEISIFCMFAIVIYLIFDVTTDKANNNRGRVRFTFGLKSVGSRILLGVSFT